jgi:hypothetical protein
MNTEFAGHAGDRPLRNSYSLRILSNGSSLISNPITHLHSAIHLE